jgi:hypothetical protein
MKKWHCGGHRLGHAELISWRKKFTECLKEEPKMIERCENGDEMDEGN